MKKIIKFLSIIILSIISFFVVSCSDKKSNEFTIFSVNDTHGYLEDSGKSSFSKIGGYIESERKSIDNNALISVGDTFQGTALSNLTRGKSLIDSMNALEFDCMVVGNHEFDWGIETILNYFDGDTTNGEANFPLLCANLVRKDGADIEGLKDYTFIQMDSIKIGVIGTIGYGLESSISASKIKDYSILEPYDITSNIIGEIKDKCDFVVLATHASSEYNDLYMDFDNKPDLILNGHTHQEEYGIVGGINYLQSGSNSLYLGRTDVKLDTNEISVSNIDVSTLQARSEKIDDIISAYSISLKHIMEEKITKLTSSFSRTSCAKYCTKVMRNETNVDVFFMNGGGIRTSLTKNQEVLYKDLVTLVPFDNEIKLTKLSGLDLKKLIDFQLDDYDLISSETLSCTNGEYFMNNIKIKDSDIYYVGAIDYVFDKSYYPFLNGKDIEFTGLYLRDLLASDLRLTNNNWSIYAEPAK